MDSDVISRLLFQCVNIKKNDMKDHIFVLYGITIGMKPDLIFEIGVRRGNSTLAFLLALKELGKGKLFSIDIKDHRKTIGVVRDRVAEAEAEQFWEFECADSFEFCRIWKNPIDMLFIDGSHTLEAVTNDFENYSPFVRKNGLILMHDGFYGEKQFPIDECGVELYIPNIREKQDQFELVTLPYCFGLTIIRKLI